MGQSDGLRSAVFERGSARVISATFFRAFLLLWSVYLERDVQGLFDKMKIHRSYVGTSLRRGTFPPLGSYSRPMPMVLRRSWVVDLY